MRGGGGVFGSFELWEGLESCWERGGRDVLGGRRGSFLCGVLEREEDGFGEGGWGAIWKRGIEASEWWRKKELVSEER